MQTIYTPNAPEPIGPYSQGQKVGNLIFFSGQIALDTSGNFLGDSLQTECDQVFSNIAALLSEAKCTPNNVIKTTVFLADLNDFEAVNTAYSAFFGDHAPARSCVQVAKLPKGARLEIEIVVEEG